MMILHKDNTKEYLPLFKTLEDVSKSENEAPEVSLFRFNNNTGGNLLERYSHMLQNLVTFEKETDDIKEPAALVDKLNLAAKRVLPVKDASLLFFNENYQKLQPIDNRDNTQLVILLNQYYQEGILTLLFESGKPHLQ